MDVFSEYGTESGFRFYLLYLPFRSRQTAKLF
jgi:hypothetical protein